MAETHVISALIAKRSELAGIAEHHKKEMNRIVEEIRSLDSAIKLFEPEYRVHGIKTKRYTKKNIFFQRGESNRTILDILRISKEPISTNQIAETIAATKGIGSDALDDLKATVLSTLHRQRKAGLVTMPFKNEAGVCCWVLVD